MLDRLILIFCLYIPFQVALNPLAGVDLASIRIFSLILFFIWLAKSLFRGNLRIPFNAQSGMIATFLILISISSLWSANQEWSLRKLAFWYSLAPLYLVFSSTVETPDRLKKVISFLVLGGAASALIGIVQFFAQFFWGLEKVYLFWSENLAPVFLGQTFSQSVLQNPSWLVNIGGETYIRAISFFPDPHMFSFYLGMIVPLSLGICLVKKEKRFIWIIFLVLIIIADLLTFSRGGYLGLLVAAVFLLVWSWKYLSRRACYIILILGTAIIGIMFIYGPVSQRFYSIFNLKEGSNLGRIETWKEASSVINRNWLTGVGIGSYPIAVKPSVQYREPIYAHNAYLDITADSGIFSLLAWVGFMIISIINQVKKGRSFILLFFSGLSLVIFCIHSLVETGIYSPAVLSLLFILTSFSNVEIYGTKTLAKN